MLIFYKQATVRALKGRTQHRTNQTNLGSKSQGSHPRGSEPQLGDQIETILLRCHFISAALQTPPKAVKILVDFSTKCQQINFQIQPGVVSILIYVFKLAHVYKPGTSEAKTGRFRNPRVIWAL